MEVTKIFIIVNVAAVGAVVVTVKVVYPKIKLIIETSSKNRC